LGNQPPNKQRNRSESEAKQLVKKAAKPKLTAAKAPKNSLLKLVYG